MVLRKVESHEILTPTKGLNKNENNNDEVLESGDGSMSEILFFNCNNESYIDKMIRNCC
jgi:hypothetical protein